MDTVEIRSSVDKMNHTDKYWAIKQLCDEVARLWPELDEQKDLRIMWETAAQHLLERAEKAEAHVRTLREALELLLPLCKPAREEWLNDNAADTNRRNFEMYMETWRNAQAALDATKGVE